GDELLSELHVLLLRRVASERRGSTANHVDTTRVDDRLERHAQTHTVLAEFSGKLLRGEVDRRVLAVLAHAREADAHVGVTIVVAQKVLGREVEATELDVAERRGLN